MSEEMTLKVMEMFSKGIVRIDQVIFEVKGDNNYHKDRCKESKSKVTDEHIARALAVLNGKDNVIDSQRAWLGACCLLGQKYGYPRNLGECCKRIEALPLNTDNLEFLCKYESIRMFGSWKFVRENIDDWPTYMPRSDERQVFEKSLSVAQALEKEIEKQVELDM